MPGDTADILRALGRFLDGAGATGIEIVNREQFLAVSWAQRGSAGGENRSYIEQDLQMLREQAREMRKGEPGGTPAGSLAELLRTLGQEIDDEDVDVNTIVQESEGFRVSGVVGGRYFRELYETGELLSAARKRRVDRTES